MNIETEDSQERSSPPDATRNGTDSAAAPATSRAGVIAIIIFVVASAGVLAYLTMASRGGESVQSGAGESETASSKPPDADSTSSTAAMVARLETISRELDPQTDIFANSERASMLARRIETEPDPERRIQLRGQLGFEQLLAGETESAIDVFQDQLQRLRDVGVSERHAVVKQVRELLAISHLRLGEQENCIAAHGPESCILPLAGGGIHQNTRGAEAAIAAYTSLLQDYPDDVGYRWLLNIAYMAVGKYPDEVPEAWRIDPQAFASEADSPRFHNVAGKLGVGAMGLSGGAVVEDLDGDGFLDIVASSWGIRDQIRCYRNNGDGTFTDRTRDAGLIGITGGLNLTHADYDNDGDADILVLRGAWRGPGGLHPNSLLQNDGRGNFIDVTESAGLLSFHPTQTAAWADFDNDGWLDLFIGNESIPGNVHPCELFRNNGDGTFTDVADRVGLAHVGFVKGVACGDYDNDGLIDIYLSCFEQDNVLFHNDGGAPGAGLEEWAFSDVTATAGVRLPRMSFPTWFFDYDNDGDLDLLAAPLFGFLNSSLRTIAGYFLGGPVGEDRMYLYRNNGDGTFTDVSEAASLGEPILAMGSNYGDIDNDGYLDCFFGTGEPDLSTLVPNRMYRNVGGERFANLTTAGGFGHAQKGHGIAFGDLDNDGDQDIYTVLGGAFSGDLAPNALFENPGHGNRWITLILRGTRCNRSAMGARIQVSVDGPSGPRDIHATVGTGGSFGSSSVQQEIGLGDAAEIVQVLVRWPGDTEPQVWRNVPIDAFVKLIQNAESPEVVERRQVKLGG